jgi:hypothetical protein
MKNAKLTILVAVMIVIVSGCNFISNTFQYKNKTREFVELLIQGQYDQCVDRMAMDHEIARDSNIDTVKAALAYFRESLVGNWGAGPYDYSFMNSEKKLTTDDAEKMPDHTSLARIEFSNGKEFGVFEVVFDDRSNKILNIKMLDVKARIPSMTTFWLFGLLALCIPAFNIYMLIRIRRSSLKRKWVKYLAVICLNIPAFVFNPLEGLSFNLLSLQVMLGIGFSYMGYMSSSWTFGIPLGGFYWLWKLMKPQHAREDTTPENDGPAASPERESIH